MDSAIIWPALLIDLLCLAVCSLLLVRYGKLGHSHPATIYLFFHCYTFTMRLFSFLTGAHPMLSGAGLQFDPATAAEIARAAGIADVALAAFTGACLYVASKTRAAVRSREAGAVSGPGPLALSPLIVRRVVAFTLPIGLLGILFVSNLPGVQREESVLTESSYFSTTPLWTGLSLICLIYVDGFKRVYTISLALFLALMMYQGYHRFRVIIPTILVLQIFMDRRGLRWPLYWMIALYLAIVTLFFPMKAMGMMLRQGASTSDILGASTEMLNEVVSGEHGDTQFLDEFAMGLTQIDAYGDFQYGMTYVSLLTLPIPRQLWPDKPKLYSYMWDISTPGRPMAEMGMVVTYLGEMYVNFGPVGVYVAAFLIGYALSRFYFNAYSCGYSSLFRFVYLIVSCNLIQVYRDGLISLFIFIFVNMMPIVIMVALHLRVPRRLGTPAAPGGVHLGGTWTPAAPGDVPRRDHFHDP